MKKYINGQYIDMTAEEIAAMEAEAARYEAAERTRPLTAEEVTAMLIKQQVNSLTVDDNTALRMLTFYPEEDPIPYNGNMALESGKYYLQNSKIYRCTRDTVNPVYNALSELVGLYVEEA